MWPPRHTQSITLSEIVFPGDRPTFDHEANTLKLRQRMTVVLEGIVVRDGVLLCCDVDGLHGNRVVFRVHAIEPPRAYSRVDPRTNVSIVAPTLDFTSRSGVFIAFAVIS